MINDGWLQSVGSDEVTHVPSPNFNARPNHSDLDLIVLHNISLPPGEYGGGYIEQLFLNTLDWSAHPYFQTIKGLEVSSHCLIDRRGRVKQFVSFLDRAWHAGLSEYCGRSNCNDFSIGIELEGVDDVPYTDVQYEQLSLLITLLLKEYPRLCKEAIVGHSEIAPGRKTDPGPAFDWRRFSQSIE